MTPRLLPSEFHGAKVVRAEVFPPGTAPANSPLVRSMAVVRVTLEDGRVGWTGAYEAFLDVKDRVVVIGGSSNAWKKTRDDRVGPKVMDWRARAERWPLAGDVVGRLRVLPNVDNASSIAASFNNYEVLRGIRKVPMRLFQVDDSARSLDDQARSRELARQIRASRSISPLIVAADRKSVYVLEGSHRLAALGRLRVASFPALVVLDLD